MRTEVLDEPLLEFGYSGTHQEQRAGLTEHGPADIAADSRPATIRLGIVGRAKEVAELKEYIAASGSGVAAKETPLTNLFPPFAGITPDDGFRAEVVTSADTHRLLTAAQLKTISAAETEADKIHTAVALCVMEARALVEEESVDVVYVVRPPGVPDGTTGEVGATFRNLLKAAMIETRQPTQIIRPRTWRGASGVEDPATTAWNLFTALYYKAGGKPWRLLTDRRALSRCYVGVSFTQSQEGERLFASVAQVFNELGDGVVVRGGLAERSGADLQPHLSHADAKQLLADALKRYADEHRTMPAVITLHKTSSFSDDEQRGFNEAADKAGLASCELLWLTHSDNAMLIRGTHYYPPLRGTLLTLSEDEHVLYTHGSVPYYQTYPGLYIPRPLGIRPVELDRAIEDVAAEILSLTKLNWNRVRMDARMPITLLTAERVGDILRHVPQGTPAAQRYTHYM